VPVWDSAQGAQSTVNDKPIFVVFGHAIGILTPMSTSVIPDQIHAGNLSVPNAMNPMQREIKQSHVPPPFPHR